MLGTRVECAYRIEITKADQGQGRQKDPERIPVRADEAGASGGASDTAALQAVSAPAKAPAVVNGQEWALQLPVEMCRGGCGTVIQAIHHRRYCSDRCRLLAWAKRQAEKPRQAVLPGESRVERAFAEWIKTPAGRYVEAEVIRRARELKARGREHYGIAALVEVIRYHAPVPRDGQDEFRLNNNHRSLLARRVQERCPDLAGFFETRSLRGRAA
jgi:hypothetical protein